MYEYLIRKLAEKIEVDFEEPKSDSYPKDQLKKGIEVEREHAKPKKVRALIAKHHLDESKDYYTRLEKMEKEMEEAQEKKSQLSLILDELLEKFAEKEKKNPVDDFARSNRKKTIDKADMSSYEFTPALTDFSKQEDLYLCLMNGAGVKVKENLSKITPPPPPEPREVSR